MFARHVRADEFGNWSLPYSSVSLPLDGTYTVSVTATDAGGNESTAISRAGVIIDSVMPTGLGINAVATDNIIDAAENGAGFTISGTGEAGAIVTIAFSGSGHTLSVGNTVTVSGNGTWSFLVAPKEAGDNFLEGEEIVTVIQTDSVGNTSAAVTKLVQVVSTVIGSGDLRLLGDMSAATKLILNGDVTHTPALTSQLPKSIDANGFDIKATSSIDVSGVVFSNINNLEIIDVVTLTLSASQASSFNNTDNTTLIDINASGVAAVTAGGNLSALNLANVTLTLNAATTLPDSTAELPKAINAGDYGTVISNNVNISNVSVSAYGDLTVPGSISLSLTATQAVGFASGGTLSNNGTLIVTDAQTGAAGVTALNTVAAATTGTVTATISGNAADLDDLAASGATATQAYTITVDDAVDGCAGCVDCGLRTNAATVDFSAAGVSDAFGNLVDGDGTTSDDFDATVAKDG